MTGIFLDHLHGAVTRVAPTQTALPSPRSGFQPADLVGLDRPLATDAKIDWVRETYEPLQPALSATPATPTSWQRTTPGADRSGTATARTTSGFALKRSYDPDNAFHLNHNIDP